jgi:hypothetical protein
MVPAELFSTVDSLCDTCATCRFIPWIYHFFEAELALLPEID